MVSTLPNGATYVTILSNLSNMTVTTSIVTLGTTGVNLTGTKTIAVSECTGKDYTLEECTDYGDGTEVGHYFTVQSNVTYENGGGNSNTYGVIKVSFDRYYEPDLAAGSQENIVKEFRFEYATP